LTGAESFIEVDSCQRAKSGQLISGDVFLSQTVKQEGRIVTVLSDGLGSGVKASVLASMTATMALKFAVSAMDIRRSAEIIMDTLPICSVRKISYSTFTVVDMASTGETRIIEHGNPPFLLIRPKGELQCSKDDGAS
jgi:serine phosphatase RsbU (regulator of sigma subunit)